MASATQRADDALTHPLTDLTPRRRTELLDERFESGEWADADMETARRCFPHPRSMRYTAPAHISRQKSTPAQNSLHHLRRQAASLAEREAWERLELLEVRTLEMFAQVRQALPGDPPPIGQQLSDVHRELEETGEAIVGAMEDGVLDPDETRTILRESDEDRAALRALRRRLAATMDRIHRLADEAEGA